MALFPRTYPRLFPFSASLLEERIARLRPNNMDTYAVGQDADINHNPYFVIPLKCTVPKYNMPGLACLRLKRTENIYSKKGNQQF